MTRKDRRFLCDIHGWEWAMPEGRCWRGERTRLVWVEKGLFTGENWTWKTKEDAETALACWVMTQQ